MTIYDIQNAQKTPVWKQRIILCAILLLFALDVRFNVFTRWKRAILKAFGWLLRAVIVLLSVVILFFCGKVITGGMHIVH